MKKILLLCFLAFLFLFPQAQERMISGKVINYSTNHPIPGVTVMVKGSTIGTITDTDGNYSFEVPPSAEKLIFSFVGMLTQEVDIADNLTILMKEDVVGLDEVVVVGYGTSKKRDVLGSIGSVKSEDISIEPVSSFDAALQGRISGVQVAGGGGSLGSPVRVMIRGTSSISSGTEPLYVIDGIPIESGISSNTRGANSINPLSLLNSNDIESVEVLKDAAATAIYGSRGSNGVILITTRTGKSREATTNINFRTGITQPTKLIEFVESNNWLMLVDEARANSNLPQVTNFHNDIPKVGQYADGVTLDRSEVTNTDWYDVVLQTGSFQEYNASTSKSSEKASYYVSAQYRNEEGILKNNQFDRFTFRTNLNFSPLNSLNLGVKLLASVVNTENVGGGRPGGNDNIAKGGWSQAVTGALPILPIYNENGTYFDPLSGNNLKASLNRDWYSDQDEQYRTLGTVFLNYDLPFVKGLSFRTELSADMLHTTNILYGGPELRPSGVAYGFDEGKQFLNTNYNGYFSYNRTFANLHNISFTAGTETFHKTARERNIEAVNLTTSDQEVGAPGGDDIQRAVFGYLPETKFRGYFARANYNYNQKYYLGGSFRRDGSSKFGTDNLFGTFTAFSAGWIITEEPFMQDIQALNFLKLRGSYGETGNASIPQGITQTVFQTWTRYGNTGAGGRLGNIGASDITWETTSSFDLGFDYALFDNRVSGSIAYYNQNISDMLLTVPIAASNGASSIWANIGDLTNKGFEFSIHSVNVNSGDFSWTTNFNIATNSNEVEKLTPILAESRSGIDAGITSTRIGEKLGTYFIAKSAGFNSEQGYELIYEVDNNPFLINDDGEYVDAGGNIVENPVDNPDYLKETGNIIPATNGNVSNNRFLHKDKSGIPTYFGGLTNTMAYKDFEFNFTFSFQGGNYIYNQAEALTTNVGEGMHVLSEDLVDNYWTSGNKDADYQALRWNNTFTYTNEDGEETTKTFSTNTDRFLYKGDYIRLRTISLAYNLPNAVVQKLKMNNIRVYVSAHNLLTFTKYPGLDPEIVNAASSARDRNLLQGVAGTTVLPQVKTFAAGINVTF